MHTTAPRRAPSLFLRGPAEKRRATSRLPVALAVLAVLFLLAALPARVRVAPSWTMISLAIWVLAPMGGVAWSHGDPRWVRFERRVTLLFCMVMGSSSVMTLAFVVRAMLEEAPASSGLVLLSSGTAVWVTNVLVFSLLYWQMDRGGPEARAEHPDVRPDWQFPQTQATDVAPAGWLPSYVDYLALAFSTATAFSPADVLPMTARAKGLMMLESLISLVAIVIVAARAINVLGP